MTSTLSIKTEKKIYKYLKKKKKVVGWICMSEDAYQLLILKKKFKNI